MRLFSKLAAAAMLTAGVMTVSAAGAASSDQTSVLANAQSTIVDMKHDQTFGPSRDLIRRARAVLIIPKLVKAGFIFGGEGGDGVLVAHNGKAGWGSPAFYTMGSASFGFQIGIEQAQLVLFIMSDKALRAVERSEFKIGAGAGLTVVTVGASAEGATSGNLSGDIIVWTSAKGAYGGLTLNGSVIKPRDGWNEEYYGRPVTVREILAHKVRNPGSAGLLGELSSTR